MVIWQDIVITLANILLSISIINQVYLGFRTKKGYISSLTSSLTTVGLLAMFISFLTLKLYFSAIMMFINTLLWGTLFIQRLIYKKV